MKLLWKKPIALPALSSRIDVDLASDRVVARRSIWPYRSVRASTEVAITTTAGCGGWAGSIAGLGHILDDWGVAGGDMRITLSSRFCRFILIPAHPEIKKRAENTEYARHFLVDRFGAEAERWVVRHTRAGTGSMMLACGIEHELASAINQIATAHRLTLETVEPVLIKAFNANIDRIRTGPCWLVVIERGVAAVGLLGSEGWQGVSIRRLDDPVAENLAKIIHTEQHVMGVEAEIDKVFLARYCSKIEVPSAAGDLRFEGLPDCSPVPLLS